MSRVINTRNNKVLVEDLEEAKSLMSRVIGLMGRARLEHGKGLLIYSSGNSIHTFFMKFPIDLLFVTRQGVVKHVVTNMKPWRIMVAPLIMPTDCLELPAGVADEFDTKVGDVLRVEA